MKTLFLTIAMVAGLSGVSEACDAVRATPTIVMMRVNGWQNGDTCHIATFPSPFNKVIPVRQGPGISAYTWTYEDKQYGYFYMTVEENGNGTFVFEYTNDKQFDGDTFTAAVVLRDKDGKALHHVASQRGVNARSRGTTTHPVTMSPERWRAVTQIQFFHGRYDKQPDQQNWNAVKTLLEAIINSTSESNQPSKQ